MDTNLEENRRGHRRRRTEDPEYRRKLTVLLRERFTISECARCLQTSRDVIRDGRAELVASGEVTL